MSERFRFARRRYSALVSVIAISLAAPGARATPPSPPATSPFVEELPEVIHRADPIWPEAARRAGVGGVFLVHALVGVDGRVRDTKLLQPEPLLDQAALDCVRQWVFKPALANGKPISVWVAVPLRFPGERRVAPDAGEARRARVEGSTSKLTARAARPLSELLAELRARGPRVPSEDDALLRERIIRAARRDAPEIPLIARENVHRGASPERPQEDRRVELSRAIDAAPWWSEPYREMGILLLQMGDRSGARVSFELYLVADPDAHDWEKVRGVLNELRRPLDSQ